VAHTLDDLDVMYDEETLARRVAELGTQVRGWFGPDEVITVVGVLKGSFLFMADLVRAIEGPVHCEFLGVASYEGTRSTGAVQLTHDLRTDIAGKHVVVVEDIVDTGLTLQYLLRNLEARGPKSLRVVALLDKAERREVEVPVDLVGFEIPDAFVVGYGLDLDQLFRNLPFIGVFPS